MVSKSALLKIVPGLIYLIAARKRYILNRRYKGMPIRDVFEQIYRDNRWGSAESVSGTGSEIEKTKNIRKKLPDIINRIGAKSLLDIPCGDFRWMKKTDLRNIDIYIGADIVPELIRRNQQNYAKINVEFRVLDITTDPLPKVDLILCRDLFIHFSKDDIWKSIANVKKSHSKYLLATTDRDFCVNYDIITGSAHEINLEKKPFNFPKPIQYMADQEGSEFGRCLALWKVSGLPSGG